MGIRDRWISLLHRAATGSKKTRTLLTTGPYRFSRNPMLTGVFLLLFGIGFAIKSLSLVVFFTPLFVLVNVWELKEIEEPELVKRLGKDYIAYRERTPMFIPGTKIRK